MRVRHVSWMPLKTPRACRGYINFYAVYIGWLVAAVFLHLPSFKSLGFDVRTDVSMLLTIFLLSALVRPSFVLIGCLPCFPLLNHPSAHHSWSVLTLRLPSFCWMRHEGWSNARVGCKFGSLSA